MKNKIGQNGKDFKLWLKKKKLSYDEFARESGINYGTMLKWTRGARPRTTTKALVRQKFPDCPLVDK